MSRRALNDGAEGEENHMKIYVFVPTTKEALTGDRNEYQLYCGYFNPGHRDGNDSFYVRHEIEVPPEAQCLAYHFRDTNSPMKCTNGTVILPRKKVKVKRTVSVSLFNDATAKWDTGDIDMRGRPNHIGTFPVEIEVEE
jgi:hypothetical protein